MSESAVILEGEVARRFNPVDKLRATNQDSSVSDWVPSDTLDLGSLMVSENNLYMANIDDDCDAYEEVEVDVSEELEDGDYKKITGKGNDGNDYAVGLDENGNLTSEMIPSAIHIVIKPRKLEYEEGETLDFTGIHVYLMDGNNQRFTSEDYPTGEIPFEELLLPVTTAEGDGSDYSSSTLDGLTVNYCDAYSMSWGFGTTESEQKGNSWKIDLIAQSGTFYGLIYAPTAISNGVFPLVCGETPFVGTRVNQNETHQSFQSNEVPITITGGKKIYHYGFSTLTDSYPNIHYFPPKTYGDLSDILNALYNGTPSGGDSEIPVQWMRSDGEMLEDSFQISISSQSENTSNSSTSDSGSGHTSGGF